MPIHTVGPPKIVAEVCMLSKASWMLLAVLMLGAILLLYDLGGPSLSIDEYINVEIDRGSWGEVLDALRNGSDRHPPLTHFVMSLWLRFVEENDWTVRLPWALVGLANLYLVYRLGASLSEERLGLLGALLLVTAPTFLLYTRFEKYYSLTTALGLLLILAGLRLWRDRSWRSALLYGLVLILLLYTDYFAPFFLVAGQNLLLLAEWDWRRARRFLAAQVVAAAAFLPWVAVLGMQASPLYAAAEAELSGLSIAGIALKLVYLFCSFSIGETLFPWRPVAVVGLLAAAAACGLGLWMLWRRRVAGFRLPELAILGAWILLPAIGGALLTSLLFPTLPFITLPNHIFFALPFFCLLLAAGVLAPQRRAWSVLLLALLLVPRAFGIYNYFTAQEYHNPIYAVPMREVVMGLVDESQAGDVVISDSDTGFAFYYARGRQPMPYLPTTEFNTALPFLQEQRPRRVWLLTFGRDRSRDQMPSELIDWLRQRYTLAREQGYAEQDPSYQRIKATLLNRPVYRYKLLVQLYRQ
ncbi:MAG: glycosyltransferase family 39 protein [Roseiflexaceae bacterium]